MAKTDVWMPLYIGDYLRDTQKLQAEQHGAYLLLLMEAWTHGGAIPGDEEDLAAIARVPLDRWQSHTSAKVMPFFRYADGMYLHDRVIAELESASTKKERKSLAGAIGAAKRWQNDGKPMAGHKAEASQNDSPSPSPSPSEDKNTLVDSKPSTPDCPHQQIIDLYHEHCPTLASVKVWHETRRKHLQARWREDPKRQSLGYWERFFVYVAQSDFLTGNPGPWKADLEWLVNASNFVKVIEGKYHAEVAA